jgi:hypothetical protein
MGALLFVGSSDSIIGSDIAPAQGPNVTTAYARLRPDCPHVLDASIAFDGLCHDNLGTHSNNEGNAIFAFRVPIVGLVHGNWMDGKVGILSTDQLPRSS